MTTNSIDRIAGVRTTKAIKVPALVATTANITLSGEQTIDAVAVVAGDRVLVKDQTDATQNGIYDCGTGDWRRARDFDSDNEIGTGTIIYVTGGTAGGGLQYTLDTVNPQLNVSNLSFSVVASSITGFGATLVAAANAPAAQAVLDLEPGTDVQAQNANLSALSGLTLAANKLPYATGPGAMTLTDISAFGRTLIDDGDAAAARATLNTVDTASGTFTPSFSDDGDGAGNQGTDYFNRYGQYQLIGDLCYIHMALTSADLSGLTSGNTLHVVGLPFWAYDQERGSFNRPLIPSYCRNMDPGGFFSVEHYGLGLRTYASGYFLTPLSDLVGASTLQVSELTDNTQVNLVVSGVYRVDRTNIPSAFP